MGYRFPPFSPPELLGGRAVPLEFVSVRSSAVSVPSAQALGIADARC